MATAVVTRVGKAQKQTSVSQPRRSSRGRTKRRVKAKVSLLSMVILFLVTLMLPFAYTNIYANLKKTGYSRSDYEYKYQAAKIDNQRLQVDVVVYSSPGRIKAEAAKQNMVSATNYDYLDQPQTVAINK